MRYRSLAPLLFFGVLLFCSVRSYAYEKSEDIPLRQVIQKMEEELGLTFSYDPELVEAFTTTANQPYSINTLDELSNALPLVFELVEEKYVLIKTKPVSLNLQLIEAEGESPVVGAYIKLNDKYLNLVSDVDGRVSVELDWSRTDKITFESVGFTSKNVDVLDILQNGDFTIKMEQGIIELDDLVIYSYLGPGISSVQKNHSININNGELGILPSDVSKDLLVSLRTLPGLHTVTGRSGELRIRGGTPDQNLILYNDIPIYHKGYFFGTVSPFSSDFVDEIRVYRSGFGPQLGGRVGGAVEITSHKNIPQKAEGVLVSNSYLASLSLKSPIIKNKLGFSLSARSDHPFQYESPNENKLKDLGLTGEDLIVRSDLEDGTISTSNFGFWDINASTVYRDPVVGEIKLNVLAIDNTMDITREDATDTTSITRSNLLENEGYSGRWDRIWGKVSTSIYSSQSNYSFDRLDFVNDVRDNSLLSTEVVGNSIYDLKIGADMQIPLTDFGSIRMGYEYSESELRHEIYEEEVGAPRRQINGPDSTVVNAHSLYGNVFIDRFEKFSLDIGIRGIQYNSEIDFRLEPRIFGNYFISDHLTFKSSFGLYSQNVAQHLYFTHKDTAPPRLQWFQAGGNDDFLSRSWQVLSGMSYESKNWLIDIDLFYKEVENVVANGGAIRNDDGTRTTIILSGDLRSQGMDLLVKYKLGKTEFWSTYTLSKTEVFFGDLKSNYFPTNYDQRHLFSIAGKYQHKKLSTSLSWSWNSGIPNYIENTFFPELGAFFLPEEITAVGDIERFSATNQVDLSMLYKLYERPGGLKVTLGATILNLLDRNNILETDELSFNQGGGQAPLVTFVDRSTIGFAPDFMLKVEF